MTRSSNNDQFKRILQYQPARRLELDQVQRHDWIREHAIPHRFDDENFPILGYPYTDHPTN